MQSVWAMSLWNSESKSEIADMQRQGALREDIEAVAYVSASLENASQNPSGCLMAQILVSTTPVSSIFPSGNGFNQT